MIFSSNIFIFAFLPIAILGNLVLKPKWKNYFLLVISLLFYAFGEPRVVFIMIAVIILNYFLARLIAVNGISQKLRKVFFVLTITINLAVLFYFKYLNFTIENVNQLFDSNIIIEKIVLPIGISFFTFQAMSYVIDVYRGVVPVQNNILYLGLYISFFPQLIAGPIVRYTDIAEQIENRKMTFQNFSNGLRRFIVGVNKKILLANTLALVADKAFSMEHNELSLTFAWLGAIAYTFQIFFDFSGYSDMAIGLGEMFGFKFIENFNYPYISKSISEFWRRWHISLGTWFRDYVYFPLGGSKVNRKSRLLFNLLVVWLLTGIWHGASWNFIVWGLFYFLLLAFEKIFNIPNSFQSNTVSIFYRLFT